MKRYIPDAGDIVWLHFNPQAGRRAESGYLQQARRPDALLPDDDASCGRSTARRAWLSAASGWRSTPFA